jgi:hypothetical protein
MRKQTPVIIAAALSLALAAAAAAQMPRDQSAPENVRQSQQYEQALHANPAFRAKRMQQECGPITDPQLHQQCVASFGGGEPPAPHRAQHH